MEADVVDSITYNIIDMLFMIFGTVLVFIGCKMQNIIIGGCIVGIGLFFIRYMPLYHNIL